VAKIAHARLKQILASQPLAAKVNSRA
jgi:hypothetical protein